MANPEHIDILKQGVDVWNKWREEHPDVQPDLSEANLNNTDLSGVDLTNANLFRSDLSGADLSDALLDNADCKEAKFVEANLNNVYLLDANFNLSDLSRTDLRKAELGLANFLNANLSEANLSGASLSFANLTGVKFNATNLSRTKVEWTIFGDVDFRQVRGLATVKHLGPSTIGIDSLYRSEGNIPEIFLRGAGVPDSFLEMLHMIVSHPIEYYSCFISYSNKDGVFARRLYADLQSNNVRCWFAPEDLKWGEHTRTGIDEAIHVHDKLLLILSKHSVASGWVEREVKAALEKEKKEQRTVLFPVRVDRAVFDSPFDWATEIRHERNIGDFTQWKNHDDYQEAFARLLRDLKASA